MGVPPVQFERRSRPPGAPDPAAQTSMLTTWAPHLGSRHDPIRTWLGLLRHGGTSQFSPMPNPTNPTNVTNHCRTHRQSATQPASSTAATCTGARVVPPRATTTQTRRHQQLVLCPTSASSSPSPPPRCSSPMGATPSGWNTVEPTRRTTATGPGSIALQFGTDRASKHRARFNAGLGTLAATAPGALAPTAEHARPTQG